MFEAVIAPLAFVLIVIALIVVAVVAAIRRRSRRTPRAKDFGSPRPGSWTSSGNHAESHDDVERRRRVG